MTVHGMTSPVEHMCTCCLEGCLCMYCYCCCWQSTFRTAGHSTGTAAMRQYTLGASPPAVFHPCIKRQGAVHSRQSAINLPPALTASHRSQREKPNNVKGLIWYFLQVCCAEQVDAECSMPACCAQV